MTGTQRRSLSLTLTAVVIFAVLILLGVWTGTSRAKAESQTSVNVQDAGPTSTATPTNFPGTTFSNTNAITWGVSGTATPYGSNIVVSGLSGTVARVRVQLHGWTTDWVGDDDILLVSPQGVGVLLLSDVGGSCWASNVEATIEEGGPVFPQNGCQSPGGHYGPWTSRPTNYVDTYPETDNFPPPAPAAPWADTLTALNGLNPNGTWSLYLIDDTNFYDGRIENGWSITIETASSPPSTSTPTITPTGTRGTPSPTNTGQPCQQTPVVTGTSACSSSTEYNYEFTTTPTYIAGPASGRLEFQAAEDASGNWVTLDIEDVPGNDINHVTGTFAETNIPAQYTYYRIKLQITVRNCGQRVILVGYTDPAPLCGLVTSTPTATASPTRTLTPTNTATHPPGSPTITTEPSGTPEPSSTAPTATPTSCSLQFTDVPPGGTFYSNIICLVCAGVISGYNNSSDCPGTGAPCFKPGNLVTRGQLSKIVANSAGFAEPASAQQFEDVPVGSTFYSFVWRLADRGIVRGYDCGGPGEPCAEPGNLPYFRPNTNVTRSQMSKIVSEAAGYSDTPTGQQFEDVVPGSTFYDWIGRLATRSIIGGYACGGPGEACGGGNLPYFRPGNTATRGQASKVVSNTFFPACITR